MEDELGFFASSLTSTMSVKSRSIACLTTFFIATRLRPTISLFGMILRSSKQNFHVSCNVWDHAIELPLTSRADGDMVMSTLGCRCRSK